MLLLKYSIFKESGVFTTSWFHHICVFISTCQTWWWMEWATTMQALISRTGRLFRRCSCRETFLFSVSLNIDFSWKAEGVIPQCSSLHHFSHWYERNTSRMSIIKRWRHRNRYFITSAVIMCKHSKHSVCVCFSLYICIPIFGPGT